MRSSLEIISWELGKELVTLAAVGLGLVPELAGGGVEGDEDLLAPGIAGLVHGLFDDLQCVLVVLEVWCEAALVADGGAHVSILEHTLECVVDLNASAKGLAEVVEPPGLDHELLEVHGVVGVLAAVEDVQHRHRERLGTRAAQVAIEREARGIGGGLGGGHRDTKDRVCAELCLVRRAIELDQGLVDRLLLAGVHPLDRRGDAVVDICDRLKDALAQIDGPVAIAEFDSLVLAGARAAGHGGSSEYSALEADLDLEGGVAPGIEDLACVDELYLMHGDLLDAHGTTLEPANRSDGRAFSLVDRMA